MGTTLDFLGIELDTITMEARLPPEKLQKAKDLVTSALHKASLTRTELDSLLGFLSFAAKVVVPGRAFLRRLFDSKTRTADNSHADNYWSNPHSTQATHVHLNKEMKSDLLWWHHFLPKWNGIRMLQPKRQVLWLWTDASGNYGMGAYILQTDQNLLSIPLQQAFSERFTTRLRHKHINVKEMTAILHALQKWVSLCRGSHLILHCDNFAVAKGVKKTSIRGSAMHPLRAIAMLAALNDIAIESRWISTKENNVADLLSRGMIQKLANQYPNFQAMTVNENLPTHG